MTKEQAMAMLKAKRECIELDTNGNAVLCDRNCGECKLNYEQGNMGEQKIALEMAIKALEQQPSGDCVSRQAVKDIIHHYKNNIDCQTSYLTDGVCNLPSVKPISNLDKIRAEIEELDRYYDNDYFSTNNCPMYKCNEVLLIIDKYKAESEEVNEPKK